MARCTAQWWSWLRFISYYPLKQGLKHDSPMIANSNEGKIYILLSIKTRIETLFPCLFQTFFVQFISYYPLKQGLKPIRVAIVDSRYFIYILLSIKTRIETCGVCESRIVNGKIYILLSIKTRIETRHYDMAGCIQLCIYILLSIKTRIETDK